MSCYISSGIQLGCSDGIGGIKKIYIVGGATGQVTGYTYDADGAVTGATSTTGTTLYGFELKRNTSSLAQNTTKSFENGTIYWEQVLTAIFFKYDQDKRNQLKILGQNDQIQIVAIDQNDVQYLLGQVNGMYLSGGSAATGTAFGDRNGFEMIFTGQESEPARVIDGALATVFTGAAIVG
jgi:hypothetical protein